MAMEDHDLNRIKRFLPVAQNLGVAPEVGPWDIMGCYVSQQATLVNLKIAGKWMFILPYPPN